MFINPVLELGRFQRINETNAVEHIKEFKLFSLLQPILGNPGVTNSVPTAFMT